MRLSPLFPLAFLPLAALPGPALSAETAGAKDIPVEEWVAMADGHTLTYEINGIFFALEHYYPHSNRVTLQANDGRCLQGTWNYEAPHYCFYWEGQPPACFRHARLGKEILIIETQDGHDTAMTQEMTNVSDTPVTCGVPPIS
ncbi:hypothetical protein [Amaricoccus solimangrovi]|uniref:Uncharacterized protein n=1 Tax=Amaricoccus solimangrovi TaxID=2589815 RepID=A0A501WWM2_9RHOB|nr:hypothetical protein [Amaricoccus solimangrovi]TPE51351.1 hypothetical protein FJM51_08910 [Amaricoccus solimangrovi]